MIPIVPARFLAWAARQSGLYKFDSPWSCPLCQYLRSLGAAWPMVSSGGYYVDGDYSRFSPEVQEISKRLSGHNSYERFNADAA